MITFRLHHWHLSRAQTLSISSSRRKNNDLFITNFCWIFALISHYIHFIIKLPLKCLSIPCNLQMCHRSVDVDLIRQYSLKKVRNYLITLSSIQPLHHLGGFPLFMPKHDNGSYKHVMSSQITSYKLATKYIELITCWGKMNPLTKQKHLRIESLSRL